VASRRAREIVSSVPMSAPNQEVRSITANKRARFEFHVLEELECGIALTGTEVKTLRAGHASIQEAWGQIRGNEMWLVGASISVYAHGNVHNHLPDRDRRLLANRREIDAWHAQVKQKGTTLVPLALYFKGSRVKVLMALCKGKKLYDKRADKKEKDDKREMARAMSKRRER
jgi:SsrA-binding protein